MHRRDFLSTVGPLVIGTLSTPHSIVGEQGGAMYGRIGKMNAVKGQRETLAAILLASIREIPGLLSYVVAADQTDPDVLWITEVWDSVSSHRSSLTLPAVQAAIAKGRPLIAGIGSPVETTPIGGYGLQKAGR
jgi:quinol monooxygenase YgiN